MPFDIKLESLYGSFSIICLLYLYGMEFDNFWLLKYLKICYFVLTRPEIPSASSHPSNPGRVV